MPRTPHIIWDVVRASSFSRQALLPQVVTEAHSSARRIDTTRTQRYLADATGPPFNRFTRPTRPVCVLASPLPPPIRPKIKWSDLAGAFDFEAVDGYHEGAQE